MNKGKKSKFYCDQSRTKVCTWSKNVIFTDEKNKKVQTDLKQGDESSDKERDPGERERERSK